MPTSICCFRYHYLQTLLTLASAVGLQYSILTGLTMLFLGALIGFSMKERIEENIQMQMPKYRILFSLSLPCNIAHIGGSGWDHINQFKLV